MEWRSINEREKVIYDSIRSIFVHLNLKLDLKIWTYLVTMSLFPVKISEIVIPAPEREIVVETEPLQFSSGMCCVKLS